MHLLAALAGIALLIHCASAACECGYLDPRTGALWTDASLSYFNDTSAYSQVIFSPLKSPSASGQRTAGDTGDGTQLWSATSFVNQWERDFGATFRSAASLNNTQFDAMGLAMAVQPADLTKRIVYGSEIVSRRRDLLYGTFRAGIVPPEPYQGGTVLQMALKYNETSQLSSSFFSSNTLENATLHWAMSAPGASMDTQVINLTATTGDAWQPLEHRIDWLPDSASWSFSDEDEVYGIYTAKRSPMTMPRAAAPLSFRHYSNGEPTLSQGPPLHHQPTARIQYVRAFFNSSLASRHEEFEEQCAEFAAPLCSTDSLSLRTSTPFSSAATARIKPYGSSIHIAFYSIIASSVFGGLFLLLLVHALIKRNIKAHHKARDAKAKAEAKAAAQAEAEDQSYSVLFNSTAGTALLADSSEAKRELEAMAAWDNPVLYDDDEDSEDDDSTLFDFETSAAGPSPFDDFNRSSLVGSAYRPPEYRLSKRPESDYDAAVQLSTRLDQLTDASSSVVGPSASFATPRNRASFHSRSSSRLQFQETPNGTFVSPLLHKDGTATPDIELDNLAGPSSARVRAGGSVMSSNGGGGGGRGGTESPYLRSPLARSRTNSVLIQGGTELPVLWDANMIEWKKAQPVNASSDDDAHASTAAAVGQLAEVREDQSSSVQNVRSSWRARVRKLFFADEIGITSSGTAKLAALDGMRGFAALMVAVHHWLLMYFYAVTTPSAPAHYPTLERWLHRILGPIISNGSLNVMVFMALASRLIANRWLARGSLQDLAESIHRRLPRLMFPVVAAILLSYFLNEARAYYWVPALPSRTWSTWVFIQNYRNFGVFLNDLILLLFNRPGTAPVMVSTYATGILWTIPVIIESSWTTFICALVARQFPNHYKRYGFYLMAWLAAWWANRWDYVFLAGLIVADLDNTLKYRSKDTFRIPGIRLRFHAQIFGWAILLGGFAATWLEYASEHRWSVIDKEFSIHPDFESGQPNAWAGKGLTYLYPEQPSFWIVLAMFLLADLCPSFTQFFMLRILRALGRNAFSIYLLHGPALFTVSAVVHMRVLQVGAPYWVAALLNFFFTAAILIFTCEAFTRTFDRWGVSLSRAFWRYTSGNVGRRV